MSLLGLLHAAETDEGLAAGFLRRKTGADTGVGMERDVGFEFGGEVVVGTAAAEEAQQAKTEGSQFAHGAPYASPAGVRKRARIAVVCSHSAAAFFTCRWPALVSS